MILLIYELTTIFFFLNEMIMIVDLKLKLMLKRKKGPGCGFNEIRAKINKIIE